MHITFSEQAAEAAMQKLGTDRPGLMKLAYDNEGCGCAVSGVPTLWIIEKPEPGDFEVDGHPFPLWMDRKHEVFFEERMTVDYTSKDRCFVLKSSGQIYNAFMKIIDKRA